MKDEICTTVSFKYILQPWVAFNVCYHNHSTLKQTKISLSLEIDNIKADWKCLTANIHITIIIIIIIITDLYSAVRSEDTEALDAAQED